MTGIDPLLAFMHDFALEHGRPPTSRESAAHLGISHSAVYQRLVRARQRGLISSGEYRTRGTWRVHALGIVT